MRQKGTLPALDAETMDAILRTHVKNNIVIILLIDICKYKHVARKFSWAVLLRKKWTFITSPEAVEDL